MTTRGTLLLSVNKVSFIIACLGIIVVTVRIGVTTLWRPTNHDEYYRNNNNNNNKNVLLQLNPMEGNNINQRYHHHGQMSSSTSDDNSAVSIIDVKVMPETTTRQLVTDGIGSSNNNNNNVIRKLLPFVPPLIQPRIIGGDIAPLGTFPSYAIAAGGTICGGTLIHPDIILTAAHCEPAAFDSGVLVGGITLNGLNPGGGEFIEVSESLVHPNYNTVNRDNDIMIVKLSSSASSTIPIQILNTNSNVPADGDEVTVIGHGLTIETDINSNSNELLQVTLNSNGTDCATFWGSVYKPEIHVCAGDQAGGKDSCQGDSGGPLYTSSNVQVGIVSFGEGCGQPNKPSVYVKVSAYEQFIRDAICDLSAVPPTDCDDITTSTPTVPNPTAPTPTATTPTAPTTPSVPVSTPTTTSAPIPDGTTPTPVATDGPVSSPTGTPDDVLATSIPTGLMDPNTPTVVPIAVPTPTISTPTGPTTIPTTMPTEEDDNNNGTTPTPSDSGSTPPAVSIQPTIKCVTRPPTVPTATTTKGRKKMRNVYGKGGKGKGNDLPYCDEIDNEEKGSSKNKKKSSSSSSSTKKSSKLKGEKGGSSKGMNNGKGNSSYKYDKEKSPFFNLFKLKQRPTTPFQQLVAAKKTTKSSSTEKSPFIQLITGDSIAKKVQWAKDQHSRTKGSYQSYSSNLYEKEKQYNRPHATTTTTLFTEDDNDNEDNSKNKQILTMAEFIEKRKAKYSSTSSSDKDSLSVSTTNIVERLNTVGNKRKGG